MRHVLFALLALFGCGADPALASESACLEAEPVTVLVIIGQGSGLTFYPGRGEVGAALPAIRSFVYSHGTPPEESSGDVFEDQQGNTGSTTRGGPSYTRGKALYNAGYTKLANIDLCDGSSFHNQWLPTHPNGIAISAKFDIALSLLGAEFPGETAFRFVELVTQGQPDARIDNAVYQAAWNNDHDTWSSHLQSRIALAGFPNVPTLRVAVQVVSFLSSQLHYPTTQKSQLAWVMGPGTADPAELTTHSRLITTEEPSAFDADGVHPKAASVTIGGVTYPGGGMQWLGAVEAQGLLQILRGNNTQPNFRFCRGRGRRR